MPLDIKALLSQHEGGNFELFRDHVNPQLARVLRTIGFDRSYVRAEGSYLWDREGRKYLDMLSGYGVFGVGRNNPEIRKVLSDFMALDAPSLVQMDAPLLCGLLAQELKKRVPYDLGKVFFTNTGSEGVEGAIKFARCATGRPGIVHCNKAFHGLTNGSLALNGDESFREGFGPFLPGCRQVPLNDLAALEKELAQRDVAAFVIEPIQGKGVNVPQPGFMKGAYDLCRKHGTLFVADEVMTGFGRTGRMFAIEHEVGVEPDMIVVSKTLSGGFVPVGAILYRDWIYDKVFYDMKRAIVHSSTFGKNALSMVAGLAALNYLDEHRLVARAERMGKLIMDGLRALQPRFELIKEVRGRGLMIGIEFGAPRSLGLKAAWSMIHGMDKDLFPQAVVLPLMDDHRVLTQVAGHHIDVIRLLPPLVIGEGDVRWFLDAFEQVMVSLHKFPGPAWEVLAKLGKFAVKPRAA